VEKAPAVTVRDLTIHYGKRVAVDTLSFELAPGQIALLLGPNGAGKSTTLAAMAGAITPSAGTIAIAGQNLATAPRESRKRVGFADQPPALYEYFTVAEHVGFIAEAPGAPGSARSSWHYSTRRSTASTPTPRGRRARRSVRPPIAAPRS